jgi:dihydrofolate synthase/folylpolyglutamate synthase
MNTFDQAMSFIHERSGYDRGFISNPFAGDDAARLGHVRTQRLLSRLGNPEHASPIIHVAGSKGKGSTSSFVDSILRGAGVRTGRFLSPHMHSFLERFVVDDKQIPESEFAALVNYVSGATWEVEAAEPDIGQLTAWEISTAIALLWFARCACDACVIEVGLGGTLDATNVVNPAVSIITRLDFEHTSILGSTMAEIARNKAGIIKPGKPVLSAEQPPEGMAVIEARASELDSPLFIANRDWTAVGTSDAFSVVGTGWRHDNLASSLIGQHQVDNAGLAIAAVHALADAGYLSERIVADAAVRSGLASTFMPGRFEVISHRSGATIVLDGAHTPESMQALSRAIEFRYRDHQVTVIIGMLSDKDPNEVLPPLMATANHWIVSPVSSPRTAAGSVLADTLASHGILATTADSVPQALDLAIGGATRAVEPVVVVITGSLSTVAEGRVALGLA